MGTAAEIYYETHALSEDNENGIATGWLPGRLSPTGLREAEELGDRWRDRGLSAVLTSDLPRCWETATIAFGHTNIPILVDWRLRECDYGQLNGAPAALVHGPTRFDHLEERFPGGESWSEAVARVATTVREVAERWAGKRVLIIGHKATGWGLRHVAEEVDISELLAADYAMPRGRRYELRSTAQWPFRITSWHKDLVGQQDR